jgi:hypothetical protein
MNAIVGHQAIKRSLSRNPAWLLAIGRVGNR